MDEKHICAYEYKVKSNINVGCKIMRNEISASGAQGHAHEDAQRIRAEYTKALKKGLEGFRIEIANGQGTGICFFVHDKEKCPCFKCIPNVFKLDGKIIDVGSQGVKLKVGDIVGYVNQTKYIINNVTLRDDHIEYDVSPANQNNS